MYLCYPSPPHPLRSLSGPPPPHLYPSSDEEQRGTGEGPGGNRSDDGNIFDPIQHFFHGDVIIKR